MQGKFAHLPAIQAAFCDKRVIGEIDGIRTVRVSCDHETGTQIRILEICVQRLHCLRILWKSEGEAGRKNILLEVDRVKTQQKRVENSFVRDCEMVGDYQLSSNEFMERWYGHYDRGFVNQYYITVFLWENEGRYYVQY
jgi:hypothetical protein